MVEWRPQNHTGRRVGDKCKRGDKDLWATEKRGARSSHRRIWPRDSVKSTGAIHGGLKKSQTAQQGASYVKKKKKSKTKGDARVSHCFSLCLDALTIS